MEVGLCGAVGLRTGPVPRPVDKEQGSMSDRGTARTQLLSTEV